MLLLATLLTLGGLVGLHALQGGNYGRIGRAGFYAAAMGLLVQAMAALFLLMGGEAWEVSLQWLVAPVGSLIVLVGLVLYGAATLQARVLARWCGVGLIVVPPLAFYMNSKIFYGSLALFGVLWVALERFSYRVCPWHRIPAMREVAACVLGTDRQKRLFGGLKQRLKRPGLGLPQQGLNLREGLLYGVEVGGVGRQQPQLAALLLDQFPDPFALVHGEVVHEDDLPGLEGRSQDLPHVDAEGVGVR